MTRRKNQTVSSKKQREELQKVSLSNKLAFLALIVTVVGVVISAFFGFLSVREQSQASPANLFLTAVAINSQNSQTQQAFSTQVELTNQALLATATEIYARQQFLSQNEPVSIRSVKFAKMTGSTDVFENPSSSARSLGRVGGNEKPIYIIETYIDSDNNTWLFIGIPLTASSSLYGWIRSEPNLNISTVASISTPLPGISTNLPNDFRVETWHDNYLTCKVDPTQFTVKLYGVDISHGTSPYQFTFQQFGYIFQPVIKSVTPSGTLREFVEFEEPVTVRKGEYMHVVLTFKREDGRESTWIDDLYYPLACP